MSVLPVRNLLAGDYVPGKEPKNTMDTCGGDSAFQENSLTCAVCLSVFTDPKLLPCFHTFCALCIQDVADRHQGSYFPCPACHEPTSLPPGGAAALQSNFYIRTEELNVGRKQEVCLTHEGKEKELFCVDCDKAICVKCIATEHVKHDIEDSHTAADRVRDKLPERKTDFDNAIVQVEEQIKATKEEQKAVSDKTATVERNIRERHATIVAAADKFRDEALDSLRSVSTDIDREIANRLKEQEENLEKLKKITRQLEQMLRDGTDNDILTVDKEIRSEPYSKEAVSQMISDTHNVICRPALRFSVTADVMVQKARDFLGTVSKVQMKFAESEVRVVERFRCGKDTGIEVFSLCHVDEDPPVVWVSYERCGLRTDEAVKAFKEGGGLLRTDNGKGMITSKRYAKGSAMRPIQMPGSMETYSKSLTAAHFKLTNLLSGKANIETIKVTSTDPFETERHLQFTITVGAHRAFDVDDKEQFFVVVAEAKRPNARRKVLLYRRSGGGPVATYSPPHPDFQPSDVCFYTLGHQHVLLVSDELLDAIHVVRVQDGAMTFVRYLAPGCPVLIQPTAMNVDTLGRLWVACRGGHIITMEPAT